MPDTSLEGTGKDEYAADGLRIYQALVYLNSTVCLTLIDYFIVSSL